MKTIQNLTVVVAVLGLLFPDFALARQGDHTEALAAGELQSLATAVEKLAQQLEQRNGRANQDNSLRKLEIAIAYLNFRSRRIEMFEQDLQAKRTSRNRLEDLSEQFRREEDNLSEKFGPSQQDDLQTAREEMRFRQQALKNRISRLDEEIILLENRIMDMQSQIDSVESFVERNLAF